MVGAVALSTYLCDGQLIDTDEGKSVTVHTGDGAKINAANVVKNTDKYTVFNVDTIDNDMPTKTVSILCT